MRAPVYRNIEEATTFLGLTFPLEVVLVFAAWLGCLATLPAGKALLGMAATYAAVRFAGQGRPPGFVQHWVNWQLRRLLSGGHLSAAARAPAPRFPFAPYAWGQAGAAQPPLRVKGEHPDRSASYRPIP
jgi:hypothetical protein